MKKIIPAAVCLALFSFKSLTVNAQNSVVYDQLVNVNSEWKKQTDVAPELRSSPAKQLNEQQLIQLHLSETEKMLAKRDIRNLSPQLQKNRQENLAVLHRYLTAGKFPLNTRHEGRQPYFIDDNNTYCAVGYLMKESGADDVAQDIHRTQNYSYLADIEHPRLMEWVQQSGLSFDELALIQPAYAGDWCSAIIEFHYNNTGTDVNEFIEIHQGSGAVGNMIPFTDVRFYDNNGTLYKTLTPAQMQYYPASISGAFYYIFPSNENFADAGKIELWGGPSSATLISTTTYNDNTVQVEQNLAQPTVPAVRTFNVGESESTPVGNSLTYCGFFYNNNWDLQSIPATMGAENPCTVMPVGLKNFTYSSDGKNIELLWETAMESNSRNFIIERSGNGSDFQQIGTIAASGNSSSLKKYSFTDAQPGYINHYRLKMTDLDGKFTYSKILYVKMDKASPLTILQNNVHTNLPYTINSSVQGSRLEVYDITGRSIYRTEARVGSQQLDVSTWSAGKYLVRLIVKEGEVYTGQFIKL